MFGVNKILLEQCVPAMEVTNKQWKQTIRCRLNQLIRFPEIQTTLPLSHAQFLTSTDLPAIGSSNEEWVTARFYNRARYLLLLINHEQSPKAFMIRRNGEIFVVRVHAPLPLFDGTLLDGHITPHNTFVTIDALAVAGQSLCDDDYVTRMRAVPVLPQRPVTEQTTWLELQLRPFWLSQECPLSLKDQDKIFILVQSPWLNGRSIRAFRCQQSPCIDFAVLPGSPTSSTIDTVHLAVKEEHLEPNKRVLLPVILNYPVTTELRTIMNINGNNMGNMNLIVEFQLIPTGWKPLRIRTDRTNPNRKSSYDRMLQANKDSDEITKFLNFVHTPKPKV